MNTLTPGTNEQHIENQVNTALPWPQEMTHNAAMKLAKERFDLRRRIREETIQAAVERHAAMIAERN